jgi:hypothetical protein
VIEGLNSTINNSLLLTNTGAQPAFTKYTLLDTGDSYAIPYFSNQTSLIWSSTNLKYDPTIGLSLLGKLSINKGSSLYRIENPLSTGERNLILPADAVSSVSINDVLAVHSASGDNVTLKYLDINDVINVQHVISDLNTEIPFFNNDELRFVNVANEINVSINKTGTVVTPTISLPSVIYPGSDSVVAFGYDSSNRFELDQANSNARIKLANKYFEFSDRKITYSGFLSPIVLGETTKRFSLFAHTIDVLQANYTIPYVSSNQFTYIPAVNATGTYILTAQQGSAPQWVNSNNISPETSAVWYEVLVSNATSGTVTYQTAGIADDSYVIAAMYAQVGSDVVVVEIQEEYNNAQQQFEWSSNQPITGKLVLIGKKRPSA